jgi:glyoxylase-like metal-dependent hydrolase (beta-lactamase superfamily II)
MQTNLSMTSSALPGKIPQQLRFHDSLHESEDPTNHPTRLQSLAETTHPLGNLPSAPGSVFAFPPNRDTLGGTAYLLRGVLPDGGNVLIDSPAWNETNQHFLQQQGGVAWMILTHRGAIGKVRPLKLTMGCQILVQEQEAYLLPDVETVTFQQEYDLADGVSALWTPGYSPGSTCIYTPLHGGILFTGRHLLPDRQGNPVPLRISKTFHWLRQLRSIQYLCDRFSPETLAYLCPGANTGFLRGKHLIPHAYKHLRGLNLDYLRTVPPGL